MSFVYFSFSRVKKFLIFPFSGNWENRRFALEKGGCLAFCVIFLHGMVCQCVMCVTLLTHITHTERPGSRTKGRTSSPNKSVPIVKTIGKWHIFYTL
jgi:hypothetical protein